MSRKAVFLDRDGTVIKIIRRPDHPKQLTAPFTFAELKFSPDALVAMNKLKAMGFLLIMTTNQPDVALGYLSQSVWDKIQRKVCATLPFDDIFMCRHRLEDNCPLKKPSPLMILAAADKWNIDPRQSFMIGDTDKDIESGNAAGCDRAIILDRDYNRETMAVVRVQNLIGAVDFIWRRERVRSSR